MTIRECIRQNPNLSNKDIADMCGTNAHVVANKRNVEKKYQEKVAELKETQPAVVAECETVGIDPTKMSHFWYKGKHYSIFLKGDKPKSYEEMRDEIVEDMKAYAPVYPTLYYPERSDGHLLVIDPADVHIGKLARSFETGEDYDSQIAVMRVKDGVNGIIEKSSGWHVDKTALIIGNDILHVDGPTNTTTKGTRQDPSGMWFDNFKMAKQIYIDSIERLVQIAPLHVQYDPSNHDLMSGFFLADSIRSHFHSHKHITWNTTLAHRKYFAYGKNLIGTTHGEGAKESDLPLLMAQEAPADWAYCIHRYFYKHHIHHKTEKDYGSVNVTTLRSPSGADGYHSKHGYQHAPKAIEGFLHHKEHGRICSFSHIF